MLERFAKDARAVATQAGEEARLSGSPTVEAEHLLLALSRDGIGVAGSALVRAGLSHAEVRAALEREFEHSLAAVGVVLAPDEVPDTPAGRAPRARWGASARSALERALEVARSRGDRHIDAEHILLALLRAQAGTVPRALVGAGVEPGDLAAEVEAALARAA